MSVEIAAELKIDPRLSAVAAYVAAVELAEGYTEDYSGFVHLDPTRLLLGLVAPEDAGLASVPGLEAARSNLLEVMYASRIEGQNGQ